MASRNYIIPKISVIDIKVYICRKRFKMEAKALDKASRDEISFISFIIPEFAAAYKMNIQKAYQYLKQYGGIDYLREHWWALHTDNPFWTVRDLFEICRQNGGLK